jgi:diguanylate cyclase (GGDEF)-like protein
VNGPFEPGGMPGVALMLRRGLLRLRFPEHLEREFRGSPHERGRRKLRTALLLTSCVVLAIGYATLLEVAAVAPRLALYQGLVFVAFTVLGVIGYLALEHASREAFIDRKRLTEVAMHDGLTGLLNRAALEGQVRQLWQQAARDRLPVSVVLVDIDHFKAYNDRYGHQAGDRCLRDVAATIRRVAQRRPLDLVARYGGEELVAVLFGADRSHAENVARLVREAVAELAIPHSASTTRPFVTVSVGAATLEPADEFSYDHAVQLADRAMYDAKARGRDGWMFHDRAYLGVDGVFRNGELFQGEDVKLAS